MFLRCQPCILEVTLDGDSGDFELGPRREDKTDDVLQRDSLRETNSEEARRRALAGAHGDEHEARVDDRGDDADRGRQPKPRDVRQVERHLRAREERRVRGRVGHVLARGTDGEQPVELHRLGEEGIQRALARKVQPAQLPRGGL